MPKTLADWLECDVRPYQDKPVKWLSEEFCFRDPSRPIISDPTCFLSPADGIILYQKRVGPDEPVVDVKGRAFTVRDVLRDSRYAHDSLVIGIFMTFFDVHINRIPYPGRLWYAARDALETYNQPMLDVEQSILEELRVNFDATGYIRSNQRVVNRIFADELRQWYYIVQIADYDVDCITPFELNQGRAFLQGQRFSQIRYGSQVDLIVPLSNQFEFTIVQESTSHVDAGTDPLIRVARNRCAPAHLEEHRHALFASGTNGVTHVNGRADQSNHAGSAGVLAERSLLPLGERAE
jgi:phosphatidylserine decarboxylase